MVGQGRHDLPVGFSLFRGSQHMHPIFALPELLDFGFSGTGMGSDGQELFAALAFILHENPRLSSETDLDAPKQPMGVERQGVDQDTVQENDQQSDDDRTDVQAAQLGRREQPADGPEHRLGQPVKNSPGLIQGGNINPGKNRPQDDDPEIDRQDDVEDFGQSRQGVAQEDHFTVSAQDVLIAIEKLLELIAGDDVPAQIHGQGCPHGVVGLDQDIFTDDPGFILGGNPDLDRDLLPGRDFQRG